MKYFPHLSLFALTMTATLVGCEPDDPFVPSSGTGGTSENTGGTTGNTGDESTGGSDANADHGQCTDLDEAACKATEACYAIFGYGPYLNGEHPPREPDIESKAYLACRYLGVGGDRWLCANSMTPTYNPDGGTGCWVLGDDCIPDGWEYLTNEDPCPAGGEGGAN